MEFGFTEEQLMFRDSVYRYAKKEIAPLVEEADLKSEFSMEVWRKLGDMGLLGLPFPEELGGSGADVVTCCLSGEALGHAGVDQGHLLALGAHTYLCADTLYKHGNDAQKKKYVPKLASGEWIGCMGLTEPGAGSDAASMSTTAVKKGDTWILNGSKTFITNAPVSDVCVVYATIDKKLKHNGITAFIVDKGFPGFSTGKPFHKMGVRASSTSEVFLDNCEVPEENLLGEVGKGIGVHARDALLGPERAPRALHRHACSSHRGMHQVFAGAGAVRQADQPVPGDPAQARGHEDHQGSRQDGGVPRRPRQGLGQAPQPHAHLHREGDSGRLGIKAASEAVADFRRVRLHP